MLSIDEAIEELKNENGYYANNGMTDVAEFNTKIIRMLEELKVIKEKGRYVQGFRAGYKVAIGDFTNRMLEEGVIGLVQFAKIKEIAEQLKEQK